MKAITVNQLLKACQEQVAKGNGDKQIIVASDDEGNGGHLMYYIFSDKASTALLNSPVSKAEEKDFIVLG